MASPCTGVWPSYWQDPAFNVQGMWAGQTVSDTPAAQNWTPGNPAYTNAAFRLADGYSAAKLDDPAAQPWRDHKYDAMFKPETPQAQRAQLAHDYAWAVMGYMQEGNVSSGNLNTDWNLCANTVRQWFNMPFQTYHPLTGREFVHGLTREAPVTMSVAAQPSLLGSTVWAVAFYNGNAATTLAKVWGPNGVATVPTANLAFPEGSVIGKLLFTTATAKDLPFLTNLPSWTANTSTGTPGSPNPTYCNPDDPDGKMTMPQQSAACKRSLRTVTLMQFDVAVEDSRSPRGWVYGTFVADGEARAKEANPWSRISLLGLMWGNDPPPAGQLASAAPANPRANGFAESVIAWDVVDRLNKAGGAQVSAQPGHLGCNSRLNGPADNVASSCISCHMTASIPDSAQREPPLLAEFNPKTRPLTHQCQPANAPASGQLNGVTFAQMDSIYFAQTHSGTAANMLVNGESILGPDQPVYPDGAKVWKSTDFSLQLSTAIAEWMVWQDGLAAVKTTPTAVAAAAPPTPVVAPAPAAAPAPGAAPAPAAAAPAVVTAANPKAAAVSVVPAPPHPRVFTAMVPERGELKGQKQHKSQKSPEKAKGAAKPPQGGDTRHAPTSGG